MSKKRLFLIIIIVIIFLLAIIISNMYYENKYKVSFETGTDEIIINQYIKENNKVKKPKEPKKDGYVFKEWQLNGKKYDFTTKVNHDLDLTAKWIKEEYVIVKFESDSADEIKSQKVLKGESIDNLPIPKKENYEFIGWYLNDNLYDNSEIHSDTVLIAKYKNNIQKTLYEINDKVKIVDKYSNSAYSINAEYDVAIGWERRILYIIEDTNYPYAVGDDTGVLGYFKENSLKGE